jgi:hypothetical protein
MQMVCKYACTTWIITIMVCNLFLNFISTRLTTQYIGIYSQQISFISLITVEFLCVDTVFTHSYVKKLRGCCQKWNKLDMGSLHVVISKTNTSVSWRHTTIGWFRALMSLVVCAHYIINLRHYKSNILISKIRIESPLLPLYNTFSSTISTR